MSDPLIFYSAGELCSGCKALEELLRRWGVEFQKKDIRSIGQEERVDLIVFARTSGYADKPDRLLTAPILRKGEEVLPWYVITPGLPGYDDLKLKMFLGPQRP